MVSYCLPAVGIVAQQVKSVGLNPLNLPAIERGILVGHFERRTRAVHSGHPRAPLRQMQRKPSLVTENVQRLAVCILGGGGVVFPLIEECSGLLPRERLIMERRRSW